MNSDIDNLAESTKVGGNEFLSAESTKVGGNEFLSVTHVDLSSYDEMVDLSTRKRKFGQCTRSGAKRLKYKLYD